MTAAQMIRLLDRLGYTKEEIAGKIGVHRNTIYKWESEARQPKPASRRALEDFVKSAPSKVYMPPKISGRRCLRKRGEAVV
jgi:DNA-binding XRE family transcriptional regulator